MTESGSDGNIGTYLDVMRDLGSRVPEPSEHELLEQAVETLTEVEMQRRFVALLEAVNPNASCDCSDLSQVNEGEARVCAYHTSRVGWIVHQARQLLPQVPE